MLRRLSPVAADGIDSDLTKRLAWITDPHFDHATLRIWRSWAEEVHRYAPHALIITGDISEGEDVAYQLACLADTFDRPIYFVLGNHDFYGRSIAETRRTIADFARDHDHLHYLTECGPVFLTAESVLLGEDGWGDASEGDFYGSTIQLNDFELIEDFRGRTPEICWSILQREGRGSSERLSQKLNEIPAAVRHVLIATHVPPFREACWYDGHITDDNWAPFFVCGQVGAALRRIATANPDRQHTVLCGHTHHEGDASILHNLTVRTGYSRYGTLDIESIINVDVDGFHAPRAR